MAFTVANNTLFCSIGDIIYKRMDGWIQTSVGTTGSPPLCIWLVFRFITPMKAMTIPDRIF